MLRSCLITEEINRENVQGLTLLDPFKTAATYVPPLKREGVDVIIALTHLEYAEDRRPAELFPDIDVIICGREHSPIATTIGRSLISKAESLQHARRQQAPGESGGRESPGERLGKIDSSARDDCTAG